ncbi:MAG: hypothetical protein K5696_10875 [Lachnospiraceae bacterium]|nr:hypothetical protein [Lachnospiraceae bacterium]
MIFPVVLVVMVLILHLAFYLYGRCILSQDVYLLAFRASTVNEKAIGTDRASYVRGIADAQFGRKYFGNRTPSLTVEISGKKVRLKAETEASHRTLGRDPMMPQGSWTHGAGASAEILDPAARIRKIDRISDLVRMGMEAKGGNNGD